MAIIWRCDRAGKHYEVRRAGNSLRLYTNGAFHSQYNPRHLFTGAVWDLLSVPVLFDPGQPRRLLMLGVGGGTAIHQLCRLVPGCGITAIELDPVHVEIARRLFRVEADNVELIEADAVQWLKRHRSTWDVIIDDLFLDAPDDPERPQPVDASWLARLIGRTRGNGVVIQNHLSPQLVRGLISRHGTQLRAAFESALCFTTPHYTNGVLALYRNSVDRKAAERHTRDRIAALDRAAARQLRFRCFQLF